MKVPINPGALDFETLQTEADKADVHAVAIDVDRLSVVQLADLAEAIEERREWLGQRKNDLAEEVRRAIVVLSEALDAFAGAGGEGCLRFPTGTPAASRLGLRIAMALEFERHAEEERT